MNRSTNNSVTSESGSYICEGRASLRLTLLDTRQWKGNEPPSRLEKSLIAMKPTAVRSKLSIRLERETGGASRRAPESKALTGSHYARFEPVTVRAAARLHRMTARGRLTSWELRFFLAELIRMDGNAPKGSTGRLARLARRQDAGSTRSPAVRRASAARPAEVRWVA